MKDMKDMKSGQEERLEAVIEKPSAENIQRFFEVASKDFSKRGEQQLGSLDGLGDDFKTGSRLGQITFSRTNTLGIYLIDVAGSLTERSGKKKQYDFAKKLLKENLSDDASIFVFCDDENNFRFSLVHGNYAEDGKRKFSSFRRYTYFVSSKITNKTFIKQIGEAEFSTLEEIKEAFSIEKVTKEFYLKIEKWYSLACQKCEFPKHAETKPHGREMAVIRLITRITFIWFMRERSLVPKKLFEEEKVVEYLKDFNLDETSENNDTYYKAILQNLFFATLNTKQDDRRYTFGKRGPKGYNKDFGNHAVFRYHKLFKKPCGEEEGIKELFSEIPFLNGGLFECLDDKTDKDNRKYIDGFTRTKTHQPKVPNFLFFNKDEKQPGLIDILSSYNFTIDENSADDVEIALDPELLGKVFENLLGYYDQEAALAVGKETVRKKTGSFYTPRDIVDFMVTASLKEYFSFHEKDEKLCEKINKLLSLDEEDSELSEAEKKRVVDLIDQLKILDPAIGSGAFPMGILNKLVYLLSKVDPKNILWKARQLAEAEGISDSIARQAAEDSIKLYFKKDSSYGRKLYLIKNCIYGIDNQEIAVEIAKLRFFISLLVEEKIDSKQKNFGIEPLPNLDFKLICGDSLTKVDFDNSFWQYVLSNWEKDKNKYFDFNGSDAEKKELRKKIEKAEAQLSRNGKDFDIRMYFSEVFREEQGGFDIVIGNPPYIQLQKNRGELGKKYKDEKYEVLAKTGDIYMLFYERGLALSKENTGILTYITSNKWMRAGYGEKLRKFFAEKNPLHLLDMGGKKNFENASVDTNILLINNDSNKGRLSASAFKSDFKKGDDIAKYHEANKIINLKVSGDTWFVGTRAELALKKKIEKIGKPLKQWNIKINYGIKTGYNHAFIVDSAKKNELIAADPTSAEIIKPLLRGRDIHKYDARFADKWLIATFPVKNLDINKYPAVRDYLKTFGVRLEQAGSTHENVERIEKRSRAGNNKWFELQVATAYYHEFEKEKIVYPVIASELTGFYDRKNYYTNDKCFIITGENLKYLIALFNSKVVDWHFKTFGATLGSKGYEMRGIFIEKLPIFPASAEEQKPFIALVETILQKKEKGQDSAWEESKIDEMVYELYGLSAAEIDIIEEATKQDAADEKKPD